MTDIVSVSAPLTFDDVSHALGGSDPSQTNAAKLRAQIGRGSFATIQRHLDTIRSQRMQAMQPEAVPVPAAPPELLSMWGAAVAVATAQVRTRLDAVTMARDSLTVELNSSRGDVAALTEALESASAQAERATAALEEAHALAVTRADRHAEQEADAAQAAGMLATSAASERQADAAELAVARHQIETTRLEAQLGAQALQTTIDRLTDQVGELKSLLHARTPT